MKVIFLDIDGVLNSRESLARTHNRKSVIGIDPYMALLLDRIIQATGAQVVLSSSWRFSETGKEEVKKYASDFIDITPRDIDGGRGHEIQAWLNLHGEVEKYAILDDDSDMLPHQKHFKTSFETGLTDEIAEEIINYLNG